MARWRHEIQIAIQRRRAAMARAVLPKSSAREEWLLLGRTEGPPCAESRAPLLSSDDWEEAAGDAKEWAAD